MFYLNLKRKIWTSVVELQRELFLYASDMSPAYVTMILYPCTWLPTPTAAWDWWLAQSLICSSRGGRVNSTCKILFLLLFFFSLSYYNAASKKKNTAGYDLEITECTYFFPPFYIYSVRQLACQVNKCWVNQAVTWMLDRFFRSWKCLHLRLTHTHTHTKVNRMEACVSSMMGCTNPSELDMVGQLKVHTESTAPFSIWWHHSSHLNVQHPHIVSWHYHFYTQR